MDLEFTTKFNEYEEAFKWNELVGLIKDYWNLEYGSVKQNGDILELITGGWSDNEEIIRYISETFFWFLWWQESKRGGYYKFKIGNFKEN